MKRVCDVEPEPLPFDAWAIIQSYCDSREQWLPLCRAWSELARHALWVARRDRKNFWPNCGDGPPSLKTLAYIEDPYVMGGAAWRLWNGARRTETRWTPPDFCRGMLLLDNVMKFYHGVASSGAVAFPPHARDIYLLVLHASGDWYELYPFHNGFAHLVGHRRRSNVTKNSSVHDIYLLSEFDDKGVEALRYHVITDVYLPASRPVTYRSVARYEGQLTTTTWHRFIVTGHTPLDTVRLLTHQRSAVKARRLAGRLLTRAIEESNKSAL